jgi:large subunit ribosomal protein L22
MQARLTNFRQAPRKVQLVATLLRGKSIEAAANQLASLPKKSSGPLQKLLASAVANAVNNQKADRDLLFIKDIQVNKGLVMKRFIPGAHGRAYPIRRMSSHIEIKLGEKAPKVASAQGGSASGRKVKTSEKAEPKKVARKKTATKPA